MHVRESPTYGLKETLTAPLDKPITSAGLDLFVVVPSPSWPVLLLPQHLTAPVFVTAHVRAYPNATLTTPVDNPTTSTGVSRLVVVPSPSCPRLLDPQHLTPPAVVSAHV